jgi:hypothetical protein
MDDIIYLVLTIFEQFAIYLGLITQIHTFWPKYKSLHVKAGIEAKKHPYLG